MLMNYIQLEVDKPTLMHFSDHYFVKRLIVDPATGKKKQVESLVFWVDKLDGESSARTFSVLSTKLHTKLAAFLVNQKYQMYDFRITKRGEGFATDWTIEALPLAGAASIP